jgi:hypothetical protein
MHGYGLFLLHYYRQSATLLSLEWPCQLLFSLSLR